MQTQECLIFHVNQAESKYDVHMRISQEDAEELLDVLSVLCEESEVSENLLYVRRLLESAVGHLQEDNQMSFGDFREIPLYELEATSDDESPF